MTLCPCGSGKDYSNCCGPFIEGKKLPPTPETLMRSRYTAYATYHFSYLGETSLGPAFHRFDENAARSRNEETKWLGLKIIEVSPVKNNRGFVTFIAYFETPTGKRALYEKSEFRKEQGKWYYFDGEYPKIGRNDPCPCGSGKKYKKCCFLIK